MKKLITLAALLVIGSYAGQTFACTGTPLDSSDVLASQILNGKSVILPTDDTTTTK